MKRLEITNMEEEPLCDGGGGTRRKKRIFIIATAAIILCILSVFSAAKSSGTNLFSRQSQEQTSQSQNDAVDDVSTEPVDSEPDTEPEETEYAAPHKTEDVPLSTEAVQLSDVYVQAGNTAQLQCYYPAAAAYAWELYDRHKCVWEPADNETLTDELYRQVSVLNITAEGTDTTAVRCRIQLENGETMEESASVYIIPDIQEISVKETYAMDAGSYISCREIPVHVSYADGTQADISGLQGLSFIESTEEKELSYSETGNPVEIITKRNMECSYTYVGMEEKELILRYRVGEQTVDTEVTLQGKDLCAPVISDVTVGGFEITNIDAPVTAAIKITAADDKTPYPELEYAFIPKSAEGDTIPDETEWTRTAAFELDITQNGVWMAFCRDRAGNTAFVEKEIIVVDQKPPVIAVSIADTGWCSSTWLSVEAEDYLPVEYRVISPDGTDSGWTVQKQYEVSCNGTWEVQARDSVGNVSSEDITVGNIDRQKPVIEKITAEKIEVVVEEGDSNED